MEILEIGNLTENFCTGILGLASREYASLRKAGREGSRNRAGQRAEGCTQPAGAAAHRGAVAKDQESKQPPSWPSACRSRAPEARSLTKTILRLQVHNQGHHLARALGCQPCCKAKRAGGADHCCTSDPSQLASSTREGTVLVASPPANGPTS